MSIFHLHHVEKSRKPESQARSTHFVWRLLKSLLFDQMTVIWSIKPTDKMFYLLSSEHKHLKRLLLQWFPKQEMTKSIFPLHVLLRTCYQSVWNCLGENIHRNLVSPERAEKAKGSTGQSYQMTWKVLSLLHSSSSTFSHDIIFWDTNFLDQISQENWQNFYEKRGLFPDFDILPWKTW